MKSYTKNLSKYKDEVGEILNDISKVKEWSDKSLHKILRNHPKDNQGIFSKNELIALYKSLCKENGINSDPKILDRIKMRPIRTKSGVTPVTLLTKPYPCPGNCIFCPQDIKMPKSYLRDEPGAQRALRNMFDPFAQVYNRLRALENIGHNTEKIELIILGGTWSCYREDYQIWFIKECFRAMNKFRSGIQTVEPEKREEKSNWQELKTEQKKNETAKRRCVGLVVETRPDMINEQEVIKIRRLGATKVQIGLQSLDDSILKKNKRGHTVEKSKKAIKLLRSAGFKIHAHWMPNLYGSNVIKDIEDYKKLWEEDFSPDELKIYPTSIIPGTKLDQLYRQGKYKPYNYWQLKDVLKEAMKLTPRYCRLTRVVRDIPADDIVAGNKYSNFRQIVEKELIEEGSPCKCIRCREIKGREISENDLILEQIKYNTPVGKEVFLSYMTVKNDMIAAFLRLLLPNKVKTKNHFIDELCNSAIIREVHVYGEVVGIGKKRSAKAQHIGLGKKLINTAKLIASNNGFNKISVISAVGTREYYRKLGFKLGELYMYYKLIK